MQKPFPLIILSIALLFFSVPAGNADDPLQEARQLSNEIYRLSQDMVFHGSEGHADEIVSYGKKMVERAEKLMKEIDARPPMKTKDEKEKMKASIQKILQKGNEAVQLAEQNKNADAVAAARKASFQAKRLRQQLQALKKG